MGAFLPREDGVEPRLDGGRRHAGVDDQDVGAQIGIAGGRDLGHAVDRGHRGHPAEHGPSGRMANLVHRAMLRARHGSFNAACERSFDREEPGHG